MTYPSFTFQTVSKESSMPAQPAPDAHASELLGSLTTEQQQRTSARVIKKLRLEPAHPDKRVENHHDAHASEQLGSLTKEQEQRTSARVIKKLRLEPAHPDKRDIPECDTPIKIDEKDPLKFPTVKQRMPKALWSADEKSLFFEALNEYGKDFDAITAHICAKMKKKGMPDVNLKTKTQVSHFYYRTWHKLSKHVHFGENVKKVAQELYALINYGELRKKLVSVSEKTCARLHEMVLGGSMVVRHRGRNVRARTPMCRALRRLNQITERGCALGVCSLTQVSLRARSGSSWARVAAAAHNPRAAAALPPRARLKHFIAALEKRWQGAKVKCKPKLEYMEPEAEEAEPPRSEENDDDLEEHLNLEPDRIIVQEQKLAKKPVLHLGPRPNAAVRLPVVCASEQLSSQKICFASYLQRTHQPKDCGDKIRTPKRLHKDSGEKEKRDEVEQKKPKLEDEPRLLNIDETAVDGIDLMANYKTHQEDEEKPSTEDEKETKAEETAEEEGERDKYMSEREKDSFSEMEDDDKYIKSDSDNESDKDKGEKNTKFKNLKVKFRLRPKKCGGSSYTLVTEKDKDSDEQKIEESKDDEPDIDVDRAIRQIRKGWSVYDAGDLTIGDLYLMFGSRSKLELDYWWAEPTPPLSPPKEDKSPPLDKRAVERTPDKGTDSSVEDERERRESDGELFSPKAFGQDSNDGLSGDERKAEALAASPERKPARSLSLACKLINRPAPAPAPDTAAQGLSQLSDRLKRLLAMAGNPLLGGAGARCACGHSCAITRKQAPKQVFQPGVPGAPAAGAVAPRAREAGAPVFRHPTPIAPKPNNDSVAEMSLAGVPRWRRGRPRAADRQVVVQRLLPLLPKLPPPSNLIPVKIVPNSPPAPPRIMPKPPPTSTSDLLSREALAASPERKPARSLSLACKLINRPAPAPAPDTAAQGLSQLSDRLKRLLAMAGNPLLGGAGARLRMRPLLRHHQKQAPKQVFQPGVPGAPAAGAVAPRAREAGAPVFRHPTPIAPKPNNDSVAEMSLAGVPRWRRGRPRAADRQVVVQRLLPLLPKLPPPSNLIPVKIVPNSPPAPPRIMPKPPPTSTSDLSFFYVLSESNGQFFFHDGDRRIPISPLNQDQTDDEEIQDEDTKEDIKMDITATEVQTPKDAEPSGEPSAEPNAATNAATNTDNEKKPADIANFLPAESLSLSPSRLLAGDGWLAGAVQDFSLSSFLGQLEPPQLAVDSHLQSLMAESSVDYVAKFADLAAEVTDERGPPN
ncbi:cramped chromatin regulator [Choristoneura fumiferana]|uniref:cramped chromatin regulator n=1 Tax=Choristoneura fumiferana TaxID=7141 RepID=UPI003D15D943